MPKLRGFTLIELLVTISIIALLAAIGLVVFSTALKQGRDSKRQSDLRAIQSALEQYNHDQFFYPTNSFDTAILYVSPPPSFTNCTGSPAPCSVSKTYLNSPPQDPKGTPRYAYEALPVTPCDNTTPTTRCTSYCLYANLEIPGPGKPAVCTNASYNFAVTPP